jgi:hypothetical protein
MTTLQIITLLFVVAIAIGVFFLILQWRVFARRRYWDYPRHWDYPRRFWHPYWFEIHEMIERAERHAEVELKWTAREILLLTCIERMEDGASLDEISENMLSILRATGERAEQRAFPRGSSPSLMCACLSRSAGVLGPRPETCPVCGGRW